MEAEEGESLILSDQSDLVSTGQPVTQRKRLGGELWGWDLAQVKECLPTTLGFIPPPPRQCNLGTVVHV